MSVDFLSVIEAESERFLGAVGQADPAAQVPTCDQWSAADLFWHLSEVHAFWAGILASGAVSDDESEAVEAAVPARPEDAEALTRLFAEQTARLLAELARRRDEEPAWFWLATAKTVGSTRRMQAHEATMHRIDAELVAGLPSAPVAPELAADGIAHAVEVMWAWWGTLPGFEFVAAEGAVELVATDLGRRFRLQAGRWRGVGASGKSYDEPGVVLTDRAAVAELRGTAEELYRWLWGRGDEPVTSSGDPAALNALRAARNQGMP